MGVERAVTLPAGGGRSVWTLGGRFTVKVDGAGCEGRLTVLEAEVTRAAEPPEHIHHREDEAWFVLDGAMTFYLDGVPFKAEPGAFVHAPMGVRHVFTVDVEPSRVLLIASPSGFEQFALELGAPVESAGGVPSLQMPPPEVLGPIAERYGIEVVGPPVRLAARA